MLMKTDALSRFAGNIGKVPNHRAIVPPPMNSLSPAARNCKPGEQISYYIKATPRKFRIRGRQTRSEFDRKPRRKR
jgi:hypothetical protein